LAVFSTPVLRVPPDVGVIEVLPGQSPLAVQVVPEVLFETPQVIVALCPTKIEDGLTVRDIDGGLGITAITALSNVLPVELPQVIL